MSTVSIECVIVAKEDEEGRRRRKKVEEGGGGYVHVGFFLKEGGKEGKVLWRGH